MATLTWEALGGDPAPGDAGACDGLAQALSTTAGNAQKAHATLSRFGGLVDASIWRGEAADAFRERIGELPPKLVKLHKSYRAASEGMASYARMLRDLQSQARAALGQAQAAHGERAAQKRGRDQAQAQDPAASTAGYDRAIADADQRLRSARRQINDLRGRRQAAERAAIAKLEQAGDLGIQNDPWYKRAWDAIDRWADENADLLRTISAVLKGVTVVLGLVALFAGPFAPIFASAALIIGLATLGLDAVLVATGNGDWKTLFVDVALMTIPGGKLLSLRKFSPRAVASKIPRSWGRANPPARAKDGGGMTVIQPGIA